MHLLGQRTLGIAILFLLVMLVTVKRAATGSILDKPKGSLLVQLVNVFNLFFLLVDQASHVHGGVVHFLGAGLPDPVRGLLLACCASILC